MPLSINVGKLQVAGVVAFYMSAALVMVFVNKAVLNGSPELPLSFLLVQLLIAVVLLHGTAAITPKVKIPKSSWEVAKNVAPVVFINAAGLVFNTLCLRDVEASFFQIARGLQLPLTVVISTLHTHSVPTTKVILAVGIVTCGFFIGVVPSSAVPLIASPSLLSLFYGVLSSFFIAFHAVLIKSSLPHCNNSTIELAWWTNAGSAILLLPFVVLNGEPLKLHDMMQSADWDGNMFFYGCLVTGVFGFLLCISGLLSIKVTSPITHMFSGAARSVIQTLLGVWIFSDLLTVNRASSILVILGGTMMYTWVKSQEVPKVPTRDLEHGEKEDSDDRRMATEKIQK